MAQDRYNSLATDAQNRNTSTSRKTMYCNTGTTWCGPNCSPSPAIRPPRCEPIRAATKAPSTIRTRYSRNEEPGKRRGQGDRRLIRTQPNNPYYYELKGQALIEGGDPKGAIAPFRKALSFKPTEPQFLTWLGYALVASNDKSNLPEAERILKEAIQRDQNSGVATVSWPLPTAARASVRKLIWQLRKA